MLSPSSAPSGAPADAPQAVPPRRRSALSDTVELLSSMRFAITMLVMVAIASIIGTVVEQGQPAIRYLDRFGPFWADIFDKLGLTAIYSAWWFILILLFLITSTTFCLLRNTPRMIRDMKSWRDNLRENSLRNFHHKAEWQGALAPAELARQTAGRLEHAGYRVRVVQKDDNLLVAAKRGALNKFGYIFAHSAIIVILVGGALDSDLPIQFQEWFLGKRAYVGDGSDVRPEHRLGLSNPTYRANALIPEGQKTDQAVIPRTDGLLVQQLPFTIELKKFIIEFYSTGMPKLFASEVMVHDREAGKTFPATIKVNEPLLYKGVAVYQSSFEDGGSKLKLTGYPMQGPGSAPFSLNGQMNGTNELRVGDEKYTIEWSGFRPFNVENLAGNDARAVAQDKPSNESLLNTLDKHSGSAAKNANNKNLKNVGPSVQYKLRDKTGQAREFHNYMQPVTLDGAAVYLAGVRNSANEPFSFLRIPSDESHSVKDWMRLRAALADPALRRAAAERYAQRATPAEGRDPQLQEQLVASAHKGLEIFAGNGSDGGYLAVTRFLEKLPAADQEKAANVFMKLLNGTMWELWTLAREKDGMAAPTPGEAQARFLQMAINAISDSFLYGAPVYLQLDEFEEIKASVLQITRSPGKPVVYLGCLLLTLGVFAMFYVRERRVWVWIRPPRAGEGEGAHALMAMSTQRRTLDFEREFETLKTELPQPA